MSTLDEVLRRLRASDPIARAGIGGSPLAAGLAAAGVRFVADGGSLEERWHRAVAELDRCIAPLGGGRPVLSEGGVYHGTWLESTGTISADVLGRFAPRVARDTLLQFAAHQRDDGMIPYKITPDGAGFSQIQIVTPLARVVWRHYRRTGGDLGFLRTMHAAMARYDAWLAAFRDTRGTGAVEAFCAFDTGHDLSPRFWFAPERSFHGDARRCDPDAQTVPYIAPDLTANVACQRDYLARIAEELGEDGEPWYAASAASTAALYAQCFDAADGLFYDRDRRGAPVRIPSDVLLRVLACEVGDGAFFVSSLRRYLLNTRKFLAHHGFTSIAMDDPRFDPDPSRNSWGGPVNMLTLLRAPDPFEQHGHPAELAAVSMPVLAALATADRFPQCLDPWSGSPGFTEVYSPSILWFLDAVERYSGILPQPDGEIWFSGLPPTRLDHGASASAIGYARTIDGVRWELVADDDTVEVHRDGVRAFAFPRGWRVEADAAGIVRSVVGIGAGVVRGELELPTGSGAPASAVPLEVAPNARFCLNGARVLSRTDVGFVAPVFD